MLSHLSCVQLLAALWTIAYPVPLSMGFSRQEYGSRLLCPPPEDLPDPGIGPMSPGALAMQEDCFNAEPPEKPIFKHTKALCS